MGYQDQLLAAQLQAQASQAQPTVPSAQAQLGNLHYQNIVQGHAAVQQGSPPPNYQGQLAAGQYQQQVARPTRPRPFGPVNR